MISHIIDNTFVDFFLLFLCEIRSHVLKKKSIIYFMLHS